MLVRLQVGCYKPRLHIQYLALCSLLRDIGFISSELEKEVVLSSRVWGEHKVCLLFVLFGAVCGDFATGVLRKV